MVSFARPVVSSSANSPRAAWDGGGLPAGDSGWGLYVPVHRDLVTGVVLAEVRVTIPHCW